MYVCKYFCMDLHDICKYVSMYIYKPIGTEGSDYLFMPLYQYQVVRYQAKYIVAKDTALI